MKNNTNKIKERVVNFKTFNSNRMYESSQEPGGIDAYISIKSICDYANKLKEIITRDTEVDNWIIRKLAICQANMDEVFHHLDAMDAMGEMDDSGINLSVGTGNVETKYELGKPAEPTVMSDDSVDFDGEEFDVDDFPGFDEFTNGDFGEPTEMEDESDDIDDEELDEIEKK